MSILGDWKLCYFYRSVIYQGLFSPFISNSNKNLTNLILNFYFL